MTLDQFIESLHNAGWRSSGDDETIVGVYENFIWHLRAENALNLGRRRDLESENLNLKKLINTLMDTAKEACGGSEPSEGYTWVDELAGLLRVTRLQRDCAEERLRKSNVAVTSGCKPSLSSGVVL